MIFSLFERMVAMRYLRSKKAEGFVSVIAGFSFTGIMLGVATLIIVMSVMNGFREELFSRILGINGHMNVHGLNGPLYDYYGLTSELHMLDGIKDAAPIIESQGLVSSNGVASGVMVRGIEKGDFEARESLRDSVVSGSLNDFQGNRILMGSVLADKFRVRVGDRITLTSPKVKASPFGSLPTQRSYEVAGIFDVGMYEYNSGFVFMPLSTAQKFFKMSDEVSGIEVFLDDPDALGVMRERVSMLIQGKAGVYDWRDSNQSFVNALEVERNVMFLILTLIILVAAFNIISSMIMLVKDKGHDIAIMRTMGASSGAMMRIFIMTGASIGIIGTAFGALLGIAFALNIETIRQALQSLTGTELFAAEIYFLSQLPAVIEWHEVGAVIGMALALSILATLYPAWRASRLDPVEALRYE